MGLRDLGATLPPGFRFHPSDEELVCHYLFNKINPKHDEEAWINGDDDLLEIDLHVCEPWQLPDVAKLGVNEWYFFALRDRKYATGYRTNRATVSGYWKATGKDRRVRDSTTRKIVGMRKTLVFYRNRAPNGIKTSWIMHEFRIEPPNMAPKEDWVLCRVFNKSKSSTQHNNTLPLNSNLFNYEPQPTSSSSSSLPPSSSILNALSNIGTTCYPHDDALGTKVFYQRDLMNQGGGGNIWRECGDHCEDNHGCFFWEMVMEKTICVGTKLDDDLRFDVDSTIVFQ